MTNASSDFTQDAMKHLTNQLYSIQCFKWTIRYITKIEGHCVVAPVSVRSKIRKGSCLPASYCKHEICRYLKINKYGYFIADINIKQVINNDNRTDENEL